MKKSNLFIVGAAKAGTTSVVSYLSQHSDVFMSPIKEPHYFSKDILRSDYQQKRGGKRCFDLKSYLDDEVLRDEHISVVEKKGDYQELYRDATSEKILGEASTGYLYSNEAAKEIYDYNENSKIVIILRDPIERAYSHWKMNLSSGLEERKYLFIDAVKSDFLKARKGYFVSNLYVELGLYCEQIKRYKSLFPDSTYVLFYDELVADPACFMGKLHSILGVKAESLDVFSVKNRSKITMFPKIKALAKKMGVIGVLPRSLKKIIVNKTSNTNFPKLLESDREYLYSEYFKDEIDALELLLSCDLSNWKYSKI
ncbi:MAG: sulfotransferase [Colwellia sp.]|jgi:Sulfotransferase domain.